MKIHGGIVATVAIALLAGCGPAADDVKSGPQVGDGVTPFDPLSITDAGPPPAVGSGPSPSASNSSGPR